MMNTKRLLPLCVALSMAMGTPVLAQETTPDPTPSDQPDTPVTPADPTDPDDKPGTILQDAKTLVVVSRSHLLSEDGKIVTRLEADQKCTIELVLKDSAILTKELFNTDKPTQEELTKAIDITHKTDDGFSGQSDPILTLNSKPDERLMITAKFENQTYTGTSNVFQFNVAYPSLRLKSDELTVTFRQCVESTQEDPSDPSEDPGTDQPSDWGGGWSDPGGTSEPVQIPAATPYIIVEKYSYGGEQVEAGKTFKLSFTCKNTSKTLPVENIMVSLDTEEGLSITSSSNTFYIESIPANGAVTKEIEMKALSNEKSSSPSINISFRYEYVADNSRQSQTSSERISIPVYEPDRLEITPPSVPEDIPTGSEVDLEFTYVNKGKGTLSNVEAKLDCEGLECLNPVQNLGNFESGKSGSIDFIVIPAEAKEYKIKIQITYEDASGEEVKKEFPIDLAVYEAPVIELPEEPMPGMEEPTQNNAIGVLGWIAGLLALLIAGLFGWRCWKKKKAIKQEEELAEGLNDDDDDDPFDDQISDNTTDAGSNGEQS